MTPKTDAQAMPVPTPKPEALLQELLQKCTNSYLSEIGAGAVAHVLSQSLQRIRYLKDMLHKKELEREAISNKFVDARADIVMHQETIDRLQAKLELTTNSLNEATRLQHVSNNTIRQLREELGGLP